MTSGPPSPPGDGLEWVQIFSGESSRAEVDRAMDEQTSSLLAELADDLNEKGDLAPEYVAALLEKSAPLIRERTRQTFERVWRRLQH